MSLSQQKPDAAQTAVGKHAGGTPALFNPIDVDAVLAAPRPVIDFVLPGLPAGTVGALVAPGATGKTTLAMQLCAAVALGESCLGGVFPEVSAGRAVMVTAEDPVPVLANRLKDLFDWLAGQSHGALAGAFAMERQGDVRAGLRDRLSVLTAQGAAAMLVVGGKPRTAAIDALSRLAEDARLLVLDPLRRFHDGDENDSASATALVQTVELVARRTGAAVLLSHHTSKAATLGGAGSEQQAARGSSALTDGVRWQANLRVMSDPEATAFEIPPEQRRQFVRFDVPKSNYCAPFPGAWLRRGAGGMQTLCVPGGDVPRAARSARRERGHG